MILLNWNWTSCRIYLEGHQVLIFKLRWRTSDYEITRAITPWIYSTRSNYFFQLDAVCFLVFFNHRQTKIENKAQSVGKHNPLAPAGSSISIVSRVRVETIKRAFHHIKNLSKKGHSNSCASIETKNFILVIIVIENPVFWRF